MRRVLILERERDSVSFSQHSAARAGHLDLLLFVFLCFFWLGWLHACESLVPQPGLKPMPHSLEAQILNHWTTS